MSRPTSESGTSKNHRSSTRWVVIPPVSVIARSVITCRYGRGLRAVDADALDGAGEAAG
jgi:hypothetical protein